MKNEKLTTPGHDAGINKVARRVIDQEPVGGARVIDVSKRNYIPPTHPVTIIRRTVDERQLEKYRRIFTP